MSNEQHILSSRRLYCIRSQGYSNYTDSNLSELAFGNRFAYYLCSFILLIGVISANIPVLGVMMVVAFFGIVLPNHPFDYIYNGFLSKQLNKIKLPRRSKQLKFACKIATSWLAVTIYLFYTGYLIAGYFTGALLFTVAFIVATTDFCIPSLVYNFLFKYKIK